MIVFSLLQTISTRCNASVHHLPPTLGQSTLNNPLISICWQLTKPLFYSKPKFLVLRGQESWRDIIVQAQFESVSLYCVVFVWHLGFIHFPVTRHVLSSLCSNTPRINYTMFSKTRLRVGRKNGCRLHARLELKHN